MNANKSEVKAKRKELKITFDELSSKSGIPLRTLENIFHGITKNPRIDTMQAIEKALGLSADENEPTFDRTPTEEERQLLDMIMQLTDEETEELSNFVDFILSKRKWKTPHRERQGDLLTIKI